MTRMKAIAGACLVALVAWTPANSVAQDLNPLEKTYLTFSRSIELPGMTLPAGTYTFRLADTPGRNVVQVLSRDESTTHGQFLFMQAQRPEVTDEPVVMFRETAEGTTPAVRFWYYPGERIGKEFVYPREQAARIAARTHTPVLSADGVTPNAQVSAIDDTGRATPVTPAPQPREQTVAQAPQPAPAAPAPAPTVAPPSTQTPQPPPAIPAPAAQAQAPAPAPAPAFNDAELPRTASPLPLVGLIGLLSLVGGLGVRAFRR